MSAFTVKESTIRMIKKDNPIFMIKDHFVVSPRAGFEINEKCPREFRMIIDECIRNDWLKPVAYMTEQEIVCACLRDNVLY